jgi:hypothetical protein
VPGSGIIGAFFPEENEATGTTGQHTAVRRPGEKSALLRGMTDGVSVKGEALLAQAQKDLDPNGTKRAIPKRELIAYLTEKLNGDEATATKLVEQSVRSRKRASQG